MKIFLTLFVSLFYYSILSAQDSQFTMPYSSLMDLNPAFAGSSGCSRIAGGYRNQWPNISGSFVSSYLSYDQYLKILKGGLGVNYEGSYAGQGSIKTNRISGVYSVHFPVFKNKFVICPAIEGAYARKKLDWSKMDFGTLIGGYGYIYNTSAPQNKEVVSYPDFSAGVIGYNKRFYGGVVVFHLAEPEEGFLFSDSPLPRKYVGHFGMNIGNVDSAKAFSISPSVLYLQQEDFRSLTVNCAVKYDKYILGVGLRNGDALLFSAGFKSRTFRFSYSYDLTISKLGVVTAGSHEVALSYVFNRKHKPDNFLSFSSAVF